MMRYILLLALLMMAMPVQAADEPQLIRGRLCAVTRDLSFDELVNSAGIIFKGKLEAMQEVDLNGVMARQMQFDVLESIKGLSAGEDEITLYEWAMVSSPFLGEIQIGEPYVFFFNTPSSRGLTSLTGFEQGLVSFSNRGAPKLSYRVVKSSDGLFYSAPPSIKGLQLAKVRSHDGLELDSYKDFKELCNRYMHE